MRKEDVLKIGILGGLAYLLLRLRPSEAEQSPEEQPECTEGETKCEGYDYYMCENGRWVLVERNSRLCGYEETPQPPPHPPEEQPPEQPPEEQPECNEGETRCEGYTLYECINGKWVKVKENAPECGYKPPECNEGDTKCEGYTLYECRNGRWVKVKENAPECGYSAGAKITLEEVKLRPSEVDPGEELIVKFVFNKADTGHYDIKLCIDGRCTTYPWNLVPEMPGTFEASMKATAPTSPGTYTYTASAYLPDGTLIGSKTVTLTVRSPSEGVTGYLYLRLRDCTDSRAYMDAEWDLEGDWRVELSYPDPNYTPAPGANPNINVIIKDFDQSHASGSETYEIRYTLDAVFVTLRRPDGSMVQKRISIEKGCQFFWCDGLACDSGPEITVEFLGTSIRVRKGSP